MNNELLESPKRDLDLEGSITNEQFRVYFDYRERDDLYVLKANKSGLKLFAYQLLLIIFFLLFAVRASAQAIYSTDPDSASLFPAKYGQFENYAFVLNGNLIEQDSLMNYPRTKLNNVFPYPIQLEGRSYKGAVYFHNKEYYAPAVRYANDPAYFVNGRQVSSYHIRLLKVEAFNKISKTIRDTTIDGKLYKGCIQVDTDEDAFADRISLADLIEGYTHLPLGKVIVHWRGTRYRYTYEDDIGTIIDSHFPIHSFSIAKIDHNTNLGVRAVEIDRVRFAEGERYVVHVVDNAYKWGNAKASLIFSNPLTVDTLYPCYLPDFDDGGYSIFNHTEILAQPYKGVKDYLKKLSATMGLSSKKDHTAISDSIKVEFAVLKSGMISRLKNLSIERSCHGDILTAIKKNACMWLPAIQGSRPVYSWVKMKIFYSMDPKGNILSLDRIVYRYQ